MAVPLTPPAKIAVLFQVTYDTPQGSAALQICEYTPDAEAQGIQCQIGHRKPGDVERRAPALRLPDALQTTASAPLLDGDALYVRLVDRTGRDLAVTKIDEARWPREATPTTVQTVRYWLFVP